MGFLSDGEKLSKQLEAAQQAEAKARERAAIETKRRWLAETQQAVAEQRAAGLEAAIRHLVTVTRGVGLCRNRFDIEIAGLLVAYAAEDATSAAVQEQAEHKADRFRKAIERHFAVYLRQEIEERRNTCPEPEEGKR